MTAEEAFARLHALGYGLVVNSWADSSDVAVMAWLDGTPYASCHGPGLGEALTSLLAIVDPDDDQDDQPPLAHGDDDIVVPAWVEEFEVWADEADLTPFGILTLGIALAMWYPQRASEVRAIIPPLSPEERQRAVSLVEDFVPGANPDFEEAVKGLLVRMGDQVPRFDDIDALILVHDLGAPDPPEHAS